MLIIGSYLLVNQQINVGQFIAADIVIIAIIASIEKLITNLSAVYDAVVSVEKLSTITEAEIEKSGGLNLATKNEGVSLEFNQVSFAYSDEPPVLENLQLKLSPGEVAQISGSSGSGKSTMLRLLTGAFTNFKGNILIDEVPVSNYTIESLRSNTGILLGSQDIFQGSLWQNITMGNEAITLEEVTKLAKLTGLDKYVQSCKNGYDSIMQPVGNKLSNTVRKNILLMRALLGRHRLLLLEEPFDHLAEPYKSNVLEFIKNDKTSTIMIASQDDMLKNYCSQVIELDINGRIVNNTLR